MAFARKRRETEAAEKRLMEICSMILPNAPSKALLLYEALTGYVDAMVDDLYHDTDDKINQRGEYSPEY